MPNLPKRMRRCAVGLVFFGTSLTAQTTIESEPLSPLTNAPAQTDYGSAPAAQLKLLDRLAGTVDEVTLPVGITQPLGKLRITLDDCRFPEDNPTGEAFAFVRITEGDAALFAGWMIASSPALNALDHPRYDVWVLRCNRP